MENDDLRILAMKNAKDLGEKIDSHIKSIRSNDFSHLVAAATPRFANSEGKAQIYDSVRGKDLFILSDVGNYSIQYEAYGTMHSMSYDDHFQDIKRVISATASTPNRIWVVMPLLYQSRQHKRQERESLDCAMSLQELERLGVNGIITFDVHDPGVRSALNRTSFDNIFPTNAIIDTFLDTENINFNNIVVVNPDSGATKRATYFANLLQAQVGGFRKTRDLTKVENGQAPIIEHLYEGSVPLQDQNVVVVDDMIASGGSMLDVVKDIKERGANQVFLISTFSLFSDGQKSIDLFNDAYQKGYFDKLYTTNLSYIPSQVRQSPWLEEVDCSYQLAEIIHTLNHNTSLAPLLNGTEKITAKVMQKKLGSKI